VLRSRPPAAVVRRRRVTAAAVLAVIATVAAALAFALTRDASEASPALVPRSDVDLGAALAFDPAEQAEVEGRAALGLSQPLYEKSPGGVLATAQRTEAFRPLVEDAVEGSAFDADLVEAMVFLESGGRPDVIAGSDPVAASGLTQILAETGQNFLGLRVDLDASRRLTVRIAGADARGDDALAERLRQRRREVDERFDPERALAGTVRYLETALDRLGRPDLAVVSYHMGIGNLTNVVRAFSGRPIGDVPAIVAEEDLSWARLFFETAPDQNPGAHALLARLGDDSPTYYWRVLAALEIMRLYREDPDRLAELDLLHNAKSSHEEVLRPSAETDRFADPGDVRRAWDEGALQALPAGARQLGLAIHPGMGELATELDQPRGLYRGLREDALAVVVYIGRRVQELGRAERPLAVTSTVRDEEYQRRLRAGNPEATHGYSLHTTGYAFDIRRSYASGAQASAFQFVLDDLTARGLIAWVREPAAIHVTVGPAAAELVPLLLEAAG
jgi:hypothetical protein